MGAEPATPSLAVDRVHSPQSASEAQAPMLAAPVRRLLRLQRTYGNQAVLTLLQRQQPDAGVADAGTEPLPGGVAPTPQELEQRRIEQIPPADLADADIGPALEFARNNNEQQRVEQIVQE